MDFKQLKKAGGMSLFFGVFAAAGCVSALAQSQTAKPDDAIIKQKLREMIQATDDVFFGVKLLQLGCEKPGVEIGVGTPGRWIGVRPIVQRIQLKTEKQKGLLSDLNQLKGLIEVHDARTALLVVRLRTAPVTNRFWESSQQETEIIQEGKEQSLPTYGREQERFRGWAVSSKNDYRKRVYTSARVEKNPEGYIITRWLLVNEWKDNAGKRSETLSEQKVQEWIGNDGSYRRTVLSKRPALWGGRIWPSLE